MAVLIIVNVVVQLLYRLHQCSTLVPCKHHRSHLMHVHATTKPNRRKLSTSSPPRTQARLLIGLQNDTHKTTNTWRDRYTIQNKQTIRTKILSVRRTTQRRGGNKGKKNTDKTTGRGRGGGGGSLREEGVHRATWHLGPVPS